MNYSNASISLPRVFAEPDWDFLAVTLGLTVGLCLLAFASGWWLGRLLRAEPDQRIALMFGLGMSNNGTGLVLASLALAHLPQVMLPIMFYNLVQHLVAGGMSWLLYRRLGDRDSSVLDSMQATTEAPREEGGNLKEAG